MDKLKVTWRLSQENYLALCWTLLYHRLPTDVEVVDRQSSSQQHHFVFPLTWHNWGKIDWLSASTSIWCLVLALSFTFVNNWRQVEALFRNYMIWRYEHILENIYISSEILKLFFCEQHELFFSMLPFVSVDRVTIDYQQSFFFGEDRHASQIKFSLKKLILLQCDVKILLKNMRESKAWQA